MLLTLVEEHQMLGYTSALIFANLYSMLRRLRSREVALTSLRKLRTLVTVLAVDVQGIDFALYSAFSDFEEAIQYHTAIYHQIRYLITRNTDDYQARIRRRSQSLRQRSIARSGTHPWGNRKSIREERRQYDVVIPLEDWA